jgi:thymidylate kinase
MKYSESEDSVGHAGHPSVMPAMERPATTAAPIHASVRAATQATLRELPSTKAVIRKLFDALDQANVSYCHWKSNIRIEGTLAGTEDIDLLVQRRDAELFQTVLLATGFKLVQSYGGVGHPGVFNALALDDATSELVHLHAHYQIVGGDSLVKNYRFPLEDLLLRHTRTIHGVKVPDAEVDLLLFLLRVALKHTSLIEICKVNLHYNKISAELAWLLEVADVKETQALLEQWLPMIESALVHDLLRATTDNGAVLRRIGLGWRLAWRLREFRRLGSVRAVLSRQWRLLWYVIGRFQRRRDFVPLAGGLVVALVGPKASGKSTIGSQLAARLGRHLLVTRIHAGKPPATALSVLPRLFVPMARRLMPHERLGEYEKPERRLAKTYSLFYVLRMFLLAHDRRALLFRALRAATAGEIVVSDRYPSGTIGAIDSSCFDEQAQSRCQSAIKRWFMRRERGLYRGLPKPTLVLRLVTSIDIAVRRDAERVKEGGPNAEAVRRRWDLETCAEFPGVEVIPIDTGRPLEETIRATTRAVWEAL